MIIQTRLSKSVHFSSYGSLIVEVITNLIILDTSVNVCHNDGSMSLSLSNKVILLRERIRILFYVPSQIWGLAWRVASRLSKLCPRGPHGPWSIRHLSVRRSTLSQTTSVVRQYFCCTFKYFASSYSGVREWSCCGPSSTAKTTTTISACILHLLYLAQSCTSRMIELAFDQTL